jgi:hypothetical protein
VIINLLIPAYLGGMRGPMKQPGEPRRGPFRKLEQ